MDFVFKMTIMAALLAFGIAANADYASGGFNKAAHDRAVYRGHLDGLNNSPTYGHYGENYSYKPYSFAYQANNGYGSSHHRQETGQGGVVRGSYGYVDAQGLRRTVNYIADAGGFRAQINSNEPGVGPDSPADVALYSSKPPAGVQERYSYRGYGQYGGAIPAYGGASAQYGLGGLGHGYNGQYGINALHHGYAGAHPVSAGALNAAAAAKNYNANKFDGFNRLGSGYSGDQKYDATRGNLKDIAAGNRAALAGAKHSAGYDVAGRW